MSWFSDVGSGAPRDVGGGWSGLKAVLRALALLGTLAGASGGALADDVATCDAALRADPDEVLQACDRLLAPGRTDVNRGLVHHNRGVGLLRKDLRDDAIAEFTDSIRANPKFIDSLKFRGLAHQQNGDLEKAISDYSAALKLDRKSVWILNNRGNALFSKGELGSAIEDFSEALRLDPKFALAYNGRGLARWHRRQLDQALQDFAIYIKLAPKDTAGLKNRAAVQVDKGDLDGAVASYDKVIELQPKDSQAFTGRGEALRLKGDLVKAMESHDEALRLNPEDVEAFNNRALVWRDKGALDEAEADLNKAILLDPRNDRAFANRGRIQRLRNNLEGSMADLDKAVALNPKSPVALLFRGETRLDRDQVDEAVQDFNAALRIVPDFLAAFTGRGLAFARKGDVAKARVDFEKALKLPASVDADLAKPAQIVARTNLEALDKAAQESKVKSPEADVEAFAPAKSNERRVALVVGNSAYRHAPPLTNPANDAADMAQALRDIGFEVVEGRDLDWRGMVETVRDFSRRLDKADLALFFYAGHGVQVGGRNYLVPVDGQLEQAGSLDLDAVDVQTVLRPMQAAERASIVFLDACRDNPFSRSLARSLGTRSADVGKGLASISSSVGSLVAFATEPDNVALDGKGRNSPFTTSLLKHIRTPGLEIEQMMKRVRFDVRAATNGKQLPRVDSGLIGNVVLRPAR